MSRREQDAHRPALGDPEERRPLGPRGVHDRPDVVDPQLQGRHLGDGVGQPVAALVEDDQARERAEPLQEVSQRRRLPLELEVGGEAEDEDQVDRPIAHDLVGDRGIAGLGIPGLRGAQRTPERNYSLPGRRPEPSARLADRDGRGAAGLGDLVVLALGVALDLELDPRLRAELSALLVRRVFLEAREPGLARHLALAAQAVEPVVLLDPVRRQPRLLDLGSEGNRHLAAGTGPGVWSGRPDLTHQPSVGTGQEGYCGWGMELII